MADAVYAKLILHGDQEQISNFIEGSLVVNKDDIEIEGSQVLNEHGQKCYFDFKQHKPMPLELKEKVASATVLSPEELEAWLEDPLNKDWETNCIGRPMTQDEFDNLVVEYGTASWLTWSRINWGTKWGPCNIRRCKNKNEFLFCSAWGVDHKLWETISSKYPDVIFNLFITGWRFVYQNGEGNDDYVGNHKVFEKRVIGTLNTKDVA